MFEGQAAEAARLYADLFEDGVAESREEGGTEIWNVRAAGMEIRAFDSPIEHGFTFTPASSLFVTCDTEAEVRRLVEGLAEGGSMLMEVGEYPFSPCFGWVNDRFGVSWQILVER